MNKIVMGTFKNEIPLTTDIVDKNRQALAFNMLHYMAENGAVITVNGKEIPLQRENLYIRTEMGDIKEYGKPQLDPEWYGANGPNFEKENTFAITSMGDDGIPVRFTPTTGSYEKANEMDAFLLSAIDPSVSISYIKNGEKKDIIRNGSPIQIDITDEDGKLVTEHHIPDWTKGKSGEPEYGLAVDKKYELLSDDSLQVSMLGNDIVYESESSSGWEHSNRTVYRIRALKDFGDVKAGDLGGYIESENNLSHTGDCWVYDNAKVACSAVVKDNAKVQGDACVGTSAVISDNAVLFGEARAKDYAQVSDNAQVGNTFDHSVSDQTSIKGNAKICGNAQVLGEVVVSENAVVGDNAKVTGCWPKPPKNKFMMYYISQITGNSVINGNAKVTNTYLDDNTHISENAVVSGHPEMGGHAEIRGHAEISGNARIAHNVRINGHAKISGTAEITDKITIGHNADIRDTGDFFSLTEIGKASAAFQNQDGKVTVVHKGIAYDGIERFKTAMGDHLNDKGRTALEQMENHFNIQMSQSLERGLASLNTPEGQLSL